MIGRKFDKILITCLPSILLRSDHMASIIKNKIILIGTVAALALSGCSSTKEDDSTLEAEEPVDAAPQASTKPEAVPSSSVALPGAAESSGSAQVSTVQSSAPAAPAAMMNSSRRVMYVKVDGAVLRDKADPKAKVIGKLDKGDHLLVSVEGDWAHTDDGKFISTKVLSDKGIGRKKNGAAWSGGSKSAGALPKMEPVKTEAPKNPPKKDQKSDLGKKAEPADAGSEQP